MYARTHIFGERYIAKRAGLTIKRFNALLEEPIDFRHLNEVMFYAQAEVTEYEINEQVDVTFSSSLCPGYFRNIEKRMPYSYLTGLIWDLPWSGADIHLAEVIREHSGLVVLIHSSGQTHVLHICARWAHIDRFKREWESISTSLILTKEMKLTEEIETAALNYAKECIAQRSDGFYHVQSYYREVSKFHRFMFDQYYKQNEPHFSYME